NREASEHQKVKVHGAANPSRRDHCNQSHLPPQKPSLNLRADFVQPHQATLVFPQKKTGARLGRAPEGLCGKPHGGWCGPPARRRPIDRPDFAPHKYPLAPLHPPFGLISSRSFIPLSGFAPAPMARRAHRASSRDAKRRGAETPPSVAIEAVFARE